MIFLLSTPGALPLTLISPDVGCNRPFNNLINVVFPEPLGPKSPMIFPLPIVKLIPVKASFFPYRFSKSVNSIKFKSFILPLPFRSMRLHLPYCIQVPLNP